MWNKNQETHLFVPLIKKVFPFATAGVIALTLGCAKPVEKPIEQPTQPPAQTLMTVTNTVFHDYNGDGVQEAGEPALEGIKLTYEPRNYSCITDKDGKGVVRIPSGSYKIYINDSFGKFKYITRSVSEVRDIEKGLNENIDTDMQILVPLAEGFLTWPFPSGTRYTRNDVLGRDSVFDRDRKIGYIETYDSTIPRKCIGSVCVVDNHEGIDIGVDTGAKFIASANLKIMGYIRIPSGYGDGKTVGKIIVSYGSGYNGEYDHTVLLEGVKIGDEVSRGQKFGKVEDSPRGASHLHFQLNNSGPIDITNYSYVPADPYDYWTLNRSPKYFH